VAERGPAGRVLRDAYSAFKARRRRAAAVLYRRAALAGFEVAQVAARAVGDEGA
jgi:hypothetical protein